MQQIEILIWDFPDELGFEHLTLVIVPVTFGRERFLKGGEFGID